MRREEPRKDVTKVKPVGELDAQAQARARHLLAVYGWTLYVFHDGPPNAGRDIVSANCPFADDTRDWSVVQFEEGA